MDAAFLDTVRSEVKTALAELLDETRFRPGDFVVVGCSTSEVIGEKIGTVGSMEAAEAIYDAANEAVSARGLFLAAQCCEHLNRALILEEAAARQYGWEPVNVVPQVKAGGSFATAAYRMFARPVAVEHIRAHGGIDIGDTLIGMHLRDVAVPVRIKTKEIGGARVVCARTRPKFIGGARAAYDESRM